MHRYIYKNFPLQFTLFVLCVIFLSAGSAVAQTDTAFGTNGVVRTQLGGEDTNIKTFLLPNGKILAVSVAVSNYLQTTYFIRYNSDGTPDANYGSNGTLTVQIPYFGQGSGQIRGAARQPDGKIVLVGYDYFNSDQRGLVGRFNEDGTIDPNFAGGGLSRPSFSQFGDDSFHSVLIQPDGKILIGGASEDSSSIYPNLSLIRYNPNGTPDTSFGTNASGFIVHRSAGEYSSDGPESIYLQSTGKIIVGQVPSPVAGIRRYNSDGTHDASFTPLSFPGFRTFQNFFVGPDDKILVGTNTSKTETLERVHQDALIYRFNADGSADVNFGNAGQASFDVAHYQSDSPKGFHVLPDGQILVAVNTSVAANRGPFRGNYLALARLSPTGAVNGKFLVGVTADNLRSEIIVQPDGKVLTSIKGTYYNHADGVALVRALAVPLENYRFHGYAHFSPWGQGIFSTPAIFRPGDRTWRFYPNSGSSWGLSDDIPVFADYIRSYASEAAFFRPSEGNWYISREYQDPWRSFFVVRWGTAGDVPVPADYNGDGKSEVAVFRPSNGTWYVNYMADGSYTIQQWGLAGDKPAPGDYDGDGRADLAVYRPSEGVWYIRRSSDGGYTILHFGLTGDVPVQEDYDGDGKFDIAVYRPSSGVWYRINSSDGGFRAVQWGLAGDIPVPANYDSDRKINIAVFRPSNGTWYILNPNYDSMHHYVWGQDGDIPLPAKY